MCVCELRCGVCGLQTLPSLCELDVVDVLVDGFSGVLVVSQGLELALWAGAVCSVPRDAGSWGLRLNEDSWAPWIKVV